MKRFALGVIVGMLVMAAIVKAGTDTGKMIPTQLFFWEGEGRRAGLYHARFKSPGGGEITTFWECRSIGSGKVTPPPSPKP